MNSKIKKALWVILLLIGLIPFVITVFIGIEGAINGVSSSYIHYPKVFGMEAFCNIILAALTLFAPIYVVAIVIVLLAILKLKGVSSVCTKKIVWSTLLVMLLILLVLPWTYSAFWIVYIIPVIILAVIRLVMLKRKENNEHMR